MLQEMGRKGKISSLGCGLTCLAADKKHRRELLRKENGINPTDAAIGEGKGIAGARG